MSYIQGTGSSTILVASSVTKYDFFRYHSSILCIKFT